mmetsp:Transcript_89559/g.258290  ORF Transcript_89559/g.258290 Transcript_89559/m.258290 type:complete len:461 (+) Transcript_89559:325-1707(+)
MSRAPPPPAASSVRLALTAQQARLLLTHFCVAPQRVDEADDVELIDLLRQAVHDGLVPNSAARCRQALSGDPWWVEVGWQRRQLNRLRQRLEVLDRTHLPILEEASPAAAARPKFSQSEAKAMFDALRPNARRKRTEDWETAARDLDELVHEMRLLGAASAVFSLSEVMLLFRRYRLPDERWPGKKRGEIIARLPAIAPRSVPEILQGLGEVAGVHAEAAATLRRKLDAIQRLGVPVFIDASKPPQQPEKRRGPGRPRGRHVEAAKAKAKQSPERRSKPRPKRQEPSRPAPKSESVGRAALVKPVNEASRLAAAGRVIPVRDHPSEVEVPMPPPPQSPPFQTKHPLFWERMSSLAPSGYTEITASPRPEQNSGFLPPVLPRPSDEAAGALSMRTPSAPLDDRPGDDFASPTAMLSAQGMGRQGGRVLSADVAGAAEALLWMLGKADGRTPGGASATPAAT